MKGNFPDLQILTTDDRTFTDVLFFVQKDDAVKILLQ